MQNKMSKNLQHKFFIHNYKRPTFCKHCDNLLVGFVKQGLRCKRCNIDIHMKCKDEVKQQCIEIMPGHHNFQEKSYHQPTYCDFCTKLLVGITKQGLRCSECGANVHIKCEEKIEPLCENTKLMGRKVLSPSKSLKIKQTNGSGSSIDAVSRRKGSKRIKKVKNAESIEMYDESDTKILVNNEDLNHSDDKTISAAPVFTKMPSNKSANFKHEPDTGLYNLQSQVNQVGEIVKTNIVALEKRQENIERLEVTAEKISDQSKNFQQVTDKIKKKYFFQNKRFIIGAIIAALLLLVIVILAIVIKKKP